MSAKSPKEQGSVVWVLSVVCLLAAVTIGVLLYVQPSAKVKVDSFKSCKHAGGRIAESYPEQCLYKGKSYVNEKQVSSPASDYVGLTEQEALDKAKNENRRARVVMRDGEALTVTMDLVPGRLNLTITDGEVESVTVEGKSR